MIKNLLASALVFFSSVVFAQTNCTNIGFEEGTFNTWSTFTGYTSSNTWTQQTVNGRHTLMTVQGTDVNTNGVISMINPYAGQVSLRLGNDDTNSEAEYVSRQFVVTPESHSFILFFAVVFQDPGHPPAEQPKFDLQIFDQSGAAINGPCFNYQVTATSSLPGFHTAPNEVIYRDWTPLAVDLAPYIGQTVTIRVKTADCDQGGHFGYAYFDAICGDLDISAYSCGPNQIRLSVPPGFNSYEWSTGQTTSYIEVANPQPGAVYSLVASTEAGCSLNMTYTVPTVPVFDPIPGIVSNFCGEYGYATFNAPLGFASYLWSNGATTPATSFAGLDSSSIVSVELHDGPFCDTTLTFVVDTTYETTSSDSLIMETQICEGTQLVELVAPSGYTYYNWEDGSSNTNLFYNSPSVEDRVHLVVVPEMGCPSMLVYTFDLLTSFEASYSTYSYCKEDTLIQLQAPAGYLSYNWIDNNYIGQTLTLPNPNPNDTLKVILEDEFFDFTCGESISYILQNFPPLQADTVATTINVCTTDETVTLVGDPDFSTFFWPSSGSTQSTQEWNLTPTLTPALVREFDSNGCLYHQVYNFAYLPRIQPDTTEQLLAVCESSDTISISGDPIFVDFIWPINGSTDSTIVWNLDHPTLTPAYVQEFDANGCYYHKKINFSYFLPSSDTLIQVGAYCQTSKQVELKAPLHYTNYTWEVNGEEMEKDKTVWYYPNAVKGDVVTIYYNDSSGCYRHNSVVLAENALPVELVVNPLPNAFSPMQVDGFNDRLVFPFESYDNFQLAIFNRWGFLVYETSGTYEEINWDGRIKGADPISGTYFYSLTVSACNQDQPRNYKGTVFLAGE